MKLRTKTFLIYSVLAILSLCAVAYFSYQRYESITYQRMDEFSENIFQSAVSETNKTLDTVRQSIGFLTFYSDENQYSIVNTLKTFAGKNKTYTSYDILTANRYCNTVFQNLMVTNDSIHGIYLFTPSNIVFSSTNPQYSTLNMDYVPQNDIWYQNTLTLNGRFYISTFTSDGMFTDDNDSLYFACSINDVYSHEFLGVILVDCDPSIMDLTNINTMPNHTLLTISNSESDVVLYSNIDELSNDFFVSKRETKAAPLALSPLILTASFDYDALFTEYNLAGPLTITIAIVCILSYLILSWFVTKTLIRPLETLSAAMSTQNEKCLVFSNPYANRTDEIGTLYNEYTHMIEALDVSIKRDYRDKLILLDSQMKSLEARINSHFLFNTLESINSMAEIADNEQISTMSLALGNMFRYAIKTQSELVSLSDELNHVNDYIAIQQIRFSNRFSITIDIPPKLYQLKILKLILQPLIENALYHGLDYCSYGNQISIVAHRKQNILYITISDNGKGISKEELSVLARKLQETATFTELGHRNKESIGLKNIHTRIELYYGIGYGLQIHSEENIGTQITILIPVL